MWQYHELSNHPNPTWLAPTLAWGHGQMCSCWISQTIVWGIPLFTLEHTANFPTHTYPANACMPLHVMNVPSGTFRNETRKSILFNSCQPILRRLMQAPPKNTWTKEWQLIKMHSFIGGPSKIGARTLKSKGEHEPAPQCSREYNVSLQQQT